MSVRSVVAVESWPVTRASLALFPPRSCGKHSLSGFLRSNLKNKSGGGAHCFAAPRSALPSTGEQRCLCGQTSSQQAESDSRAGGWTDGGSHYEISLCAAASAIRPRARAFHCRRSRPGEGAHGRDHRRRGSSLVGQRAGGRAGGLYSQGEAPGSVGGCAKVVAVSACMSEGARNPGRAVCRLALHAQPVSLSLLLLLLHAYLVLVSLVTDRQLDTSKTEGGGGGRGRIDDEVERRSELHRCLRNVRHSVSQSGSQSGSQSESVGQAEQFFLRKREEERHLLSGDRSLASLTLTATAQAAAVPAAGSLCLCLSNAETASKRTPSAESVCVCV